jgi:hypothetical protein
MRAAIDPVVGGGFAVPLSGESPSPGSIAKRDERRPASARFDPAGTLPATAQRDQLRLRILWRNFALTANRPNLGLQPALLAPSWGGHWDQFPVLPPDLPASIVMKTPTRFKRMRTRSGGQCHMVAQVSFIKLQTVV